MSFCSWCLWHEDEVTRRLNALSDRLLRVRFAREVEANRQRLWAEVEARL